jgi:ATP-dependent Lon protease
MRLKKIVASRPYFRVEADCLSDSEPDGPDVLDRIAEAIQLLQDLVRLDDRYSDELVKVVQLNLENGSRCADLIADMVQFGYAEKKQVLEKPDVSARLGLLAELLRRETARAQVTREVEAKTETSIERTQRETFLRQELEIIRRELEELDPAESEMATLTEMIEGKQLPPLVAEEAHREVQRLRHSAVRAGEGSSIRAYIDWVLCLPWEEVTKDRLDLRRARRILDRRYFDLGGARDRLLEFLAVRKLGGDTRLPILGIMGPPGTGRTSLASTVAEVLGRRLVRLSMHGILNEAEIRGYRRTDGAARPHRPTRAPGRRTDAGSSGGA